MDAISSTETADQQLQKLQVDVVDEESQQQGHHKQQIQASCWLRMEDDDDATVDILSGESGESTGTGLLVLGDVYAGHKQAKRYWLINDNEKLSMEIVFTPEVDKRIQLIDGELCIDNTGVMPVCDELPSRSRCIAAYRAQAQEEAEHDSEYLKSTTKDTVQMAELPVALPLVHMPHTLVAPPQNGKEATTAMTTVVAADDNKAGNLLNPVEAPLASVSMTSISSSAMTTAVVAGKGLRKTSIPTKDKGTAASLSSAISKSIASSYGSNLSVGGEQDVLVTWEQLVDGGGGGGGSAQGGGAGGKVRRSKRASDGSASSRGRPSLSGLCGRQWGQDGVSAELSGSWAVADYEELDPSGSGINSALLLQDFTLGSVMRRPFIGETSRAVRVSRANKSYAKRNGANNSIINTSTKPPPAAASTVSEKEREREKLPEGGNDLEGLATVSQNLLASLINSKDKRDDTATEKDGPLPLLDCAGAGEEKEQLLSTQPEGPGLSPGKVKMVGGASDTLSAVSNGPVSTSAIEPAGPSALLRTVLKPQERMQITVIVCPSSLYVDEATGTPYGAQLRDRTIPLQLQWAQIREEPVAKEGEGEREGDVREDIDPAAPTTTPKLTSAMHRLQVKFRSCVSLISVLPSASEVFELGMCNVGEHRTVVLEVRNDSELPAVVFPLVESEVLDVTEQEVRIPPLETRQVRLGYLAKTEEAEYWDKVALVNGYNIPNSQVMRIKSRNMDTQQILLHSMFYKLVTYNSLRQLQVAFDRCLINMPNLKVFSIKNVHSAPLRVRLCWLSRSGFRLFLVRTSSGAVTGSGGQGSSTVRFLADSTSLVAASTADADEYVDDTEFVDAATGAASPSSRLRASNQRDDIEDLKWGDNADDFSGTAAGNVSTRYKRCLSMQPVRHGSKGGAGGIGGTAEDATGILLGVSGDDGSVNYGKGELFQENKSSAVGLSRDIVSVLDLDTSHKQQQQQQQGAPFGSSSSSAAAKEITDFSASLPSHPRSRSVDNSNNSNGKEVRFCVSPSLPTDPPGAAPSAVLADESRGAKAETYSSRPAAAPKDFSEFESILNQFDKEGFPFTMIEGDDWTVLDLDLNSNAATGDNPSSLSVKSSKSSRAGEETRERPHSIGGATGNGLQSGGALKAGTSGSSEGLREKSETERRVKALQRYYTELRFMIDNSGRGGSSCLREIFPESLAASEDSTSDSAATFDVGAVVEIPAGVSHRYALLYEPVQRPGVDDINEYMEVRRSDALHIVLPDIGASDVATSMGLNQQLFDPTDAHMHDDHPHTLSEGALRPRALPVRASLVRSEMVVIQKNISFGRTVLGEKSSKGVTVVNRSSVPCLYTISKSGSISSGFLQVLGGRKGIIQPFSSKVIEFIFKPTLPGTFEEVLQINNVLNPRDAQAVTIKARVSHTETFTISAGAPAAAAAAAAVAPGSTEAAAEDKGKDKDKIKDKDKGKDMDKKKDKDKNKEKGTTISPEAQDTIWEAHYRSQLKQLLASPISSLPSTGSTTNNSNNSSVKTLVQHLADCTIGGGGGDPVVDAGSNGWLTFRIKNVTSKSRQFIVDASHAHIVELLAVTAPLAPPPAPSGSPSTGPAAASLAAPITSDTVDTIDTVDTASLPVPFEPTPEVLKSVLSVRCRFESEVVASKSASSGDGGAGGDSSLSASERKALEDSLEQFQQKLKIAIRKNKAEKIEKYQKKIDKVIIALQTNKPAPTVQPEATAAPLAPAPAQAPTPAAIDAMFSAASEATATPQLQQQETVAPPPLQQDANAGTGTGETAVAALAPLPSAPVSGLDPSPAPPPAPKNVSQTHVGESEVSYHFHLEPEQERLVRVRVTFLPGSGYKHWPGLLPFHGFLRIFESKNEDHVKLVRFGAMVRSIAMSYLATSSSSSAGGADERAAKSPSRPVVVSPVSRGQVDQFDDRSKEESSELVPFTPLSNTQQAFVATVAPWSCLQTREVYPKHRPLPDHMLASCVKLVRASRDRVMHGSLSVSSLVEQAGVLSVSVDDEFSSKVSGEYATYNAQRHGPILFAITAHQQGMSSGDAVLGPEEEFVKGEMKSLAADIGSNSTSAADGTEEEVERGIIRQESKSRISAGSKIDFSIQWAPPVDLNVAKPSGGSSGGSGSGSAAELGGEEGSRSQSLRIIGAVKVQLRVGDQLVGSSLSVPFIGVLEHKSIFTVSKYFAFEQISVGSYCTSQVPITNTSATEELHYMVSSEEVPPASRAIGSMDITGGQTGVVLPGATKNITLFFVASSAGKFEQKLWVRNLGDSFDQKRIVVQANVAVAQTKFVAFPDLESSTDGAYEKYKPIDLGLVQIQGSETSELAPLAAAMDLRSFYELKVQNVSGKALRVTAVSNLKSQCFIYTDEACTQLAVYAPVPASTVTILYVKIRPTALLPGASETQVAAATSAGASETAEVASAAGEDGKPKSKRTAGAAGEPESRELKGGIKLVFFAPETTKVPVPVESVVTAAGDAETVVDSLLPSDSAGALGAAPPVPPLDNDPIKLFETAISFKATVGRSFLKLASAPGAPDKSELQYIHSQRGANYFVGCFELRNSSKLFSLDYAYLPEQGLECVAADEAQSYKWWGALTASADSLRKMEKQIKILDGQTGSLQPSQRKRVTYVVLHAAEASGLVLCPVKVANMSTMELSSKTFATFLDSQNLRSSLFYNEKKEEKEAEAAGDKLPVLSSCLSASSADGIDSSTAAAAAAAGAQKEADKVVCDEIHPAALPMVPVQCQGAVWIYRDSVAGPSSHPRIGTDGAATDADTRGASSEAGTSQQQQQYVVRGSSKPVLGSWLFTNTSAKPMTFFPASDMPVAVSITPHHDFAEPEVAVTFIESGGEKESFSYGQAEPGAAHTGSMQQPQGQAQKMPQAVVTVPSKFSHSGDVTISPALLRWRENLKRCGGACTLEAGASVKVVVRVDKGVALRDAQLQALGGTRRLEEGKCGKLSGVVVFLQAAHSLQTLFNSAPVKAATPLASSAATSDGSTGTGVVVANAKSGEAPPIASSAHLEILRIVNIASLVCDIAAPTIQLEKSSLSLGKHRCNRDLTFEIVVENLSEVDVPCCIDNLPAFMNIEKYAIHPLKNQPVGSREGSVLELDVNALDSPTAELTSQHLFLDSQQVLSQFNSPRKADQASHSRNKSELTHGAMKLHYWLASNGNSISGQTAHGLPPTAQLPSVLMTDRGGRRRRGSKQQSVLSDEQNLTQTFSDTASMEAEGWAEAEGGLGGLGGGSIYGDIPTFEEGTALQLSSLVVNHERHLHQYQNGLTLDAHNSDLFHEALLSDGITGRLFAVPAKRQFRLTVHVKVPLTDSQLLENTIVIKNLTSAVVDPATGKYKVDQDKAVVFADQKLLKVRLQVDASRALEIIAAIDEPLVPRMNLNVNLPQSSKADETSAGASTSAAATGKGGGGGGGGAFTRLLKDPFLIPPPAIIDYIVPKEAGAVDSTDAEAGTRNGPESPTPVDAPIEFPRSIRAKSTVSKTHCRFSIKNKLGENIRVEAVVEVNPSLVDLLRLKVNFQTNNSGSIDLEPEESCAVKVRVIPEFSGRVTSAFLLEQSPLPSHPAPLPPKPAGIASEDGAGASVEAVLDSTPGTVGSSSATEQPDGLSKAENSKKPDLPIPRAAALLSPRDNSAASPVVNSSSGGSGSGSPVLLGTVKLTPVPIPRQTSPDVLNSHDLEDPDAESPFKHDVVVLDIVGYLQAAPTVTTAVSLQKPATSAATASQPAVVAAANDTETGKASESKPPPAVLAFHAKTKTVAETGKGSSQTPLSDEARTLSPPLPASVAASVGISSKLSGSAGAFSLALPSGKPPSSQSAGQLQQQQQSMPVLGLATNSLSLYLANPSANLPLNFEIKTQSFRHAGMRLLLAGLSDNSSSSNSALECDTFLLQAEPSRGCIAPATASAVTLRLVPGDASTSVKSSTTLNADIPDVQMRDRRLRSHHHNHRDPALASTTAPPPSSSVSNSSTSSGIASIVASIPPPPPSGIAEKGLGLGLEGSIAEEGRTKEKEMVPLPTAASAAASTGPYTIACMPIEVRDCDFPNHPPRIVFAYLTSDLPIPIITTQSLAESTRGKGALSSSQGVLSLPSTDPNVVVANTKDSRDRDWHECARVVGLLGHAPSQLYGPPCHLNLGQVLQRKEVVEWPLLIENRSGSSEIPFALVPVFRADTAAWLSLGQSGGVLGPGASMSVMVYFRRSLPPGSYMSYLLVQNTVDPSESYVVKVSMDIVSDAKRAAAGNSMGLSSASSLSNMGMGLSLAVARRSDENLAAIGINSSSSVDKEVEREPASKEITTGTGSTTELFLSNFASCSSEVGSGGAEPTVLAARAATPTASYFPPIPVATAAVVKPVFSVDVHSLMDAINSIVHSVVACTSEDDEGEGEGQGSYSSVGLSLSPISTPSMGASSGKSLVARRPVPAQAPPPAPALGPASPLDAAAFPSPPSVYPAAVTTPLLSLRNLTDIPIQLSLEYDSGTSSSAHSAATAVRLEVKSAEARLVSSAGTTKWELSLSPREEVSMTVISSDDRTSYLLLEEEEEEEEREGHAGNRPSMVQTEIVGVLTVTSRLFENQKRKVAVLAVQDVHS